MQEISPNQAYLQKFFENYGLNPDINLILQQTTETFKKEDWDIAFKKIPRSLSKSKFLYIFVKPESETINAIYIGKSTTKNLNRLIQHRDGLNEISTVRDEKSNQFYMRMNTKFFEDKLNLPLFLCIFKWNSQRAINNLFPFLMEFSLSNAEAGLISDIAYKFPSSILNHEFVSRLKWSKKDLTLKKIPNKLEISIKGNDPISLWNNFCHEWFLIDSNDINNVKGKKNDEIKLFETKPSSSEVNVLKRPNGFKYLAKSLGMKKLIINSVKIVKKTYDYYSLSNNMLKSFDLDLNNEISLFSDGLIYMVYFLRSDIQKNPEFNYIQTKSEIIPIYIGKTETLGRNGTFSANLKGIPEGKNQNYFARWGYDDARHIGGLSLRFFEIPNKYPSTNYEEWIEIMFDAQKRKKGIPILKVPVYFMMKPWFPYNISFCDKIGIFTPELETLLIALTRELFPNVLGKKQGR